MTVGLIVVSHSSRVAQGTAELARQMAPSVAVVAAGGTDDGSIGTSFDLISAAIEQADSGDGAVVLYDLGSALLTTETALEFCDPDQAARILIVDAPVVEGAIAAAVTAEGGGGLAEVAASAEGAAGQPSRVEQDAAPHLGAGAGAPDDEQPSASGVVTLRNPLGLHARPAAELVRALKGRNATVHIGRPDDPLVDLRSVLAVVGLRLRGGDDVRVTVSGGDADAVLAELERLIEAGFGELDGPPPTGTPEPAGTATRARVVDGVLRATPGADGRAIGRVRHLSALPDALPAQPDADPAAEGARLTAAIAAAAHRLTAGGEFAQAHAALVADPVLRRAADTKLTDGAAAAWWSAVTAAASAVADADDELVAARAVDLREAGLAVLGELGVTVDRVPPELRDSVVVADDLGPAEVPLLLDRGAVAVVLGGGSTTAHAVIVARGLGLPLVLRAATESAELTDGREVIVDGADGTVQLDPDPATADRVRTEIAAAAAAAEELRRAAAAPVVLPDGRTVAVAANVGSAADARKAVACGADAVGLLRTELLVLDKPVYPDEEQQRADLAEIFDILGDRPVVVRVLDAGGDKPVATLDVDEKHNGFLGIRGLRYLLDHPDLLRTQLRAIMRAATGHRISVMAPMVTVAAEVVAFREAVTQAVHSLATDDLDFAAPESIGVMVEVPAAALAADEICAAADFVSVGSNDLTSYTMAADRTEPGVADLLDPSATAVQRLLDQLCALAGAAGTPVAVCGEMAGMPTQATGLVDRGVWELSMAPARIPQIKALLREHYGVAAPLGSDGQAAG
jgi:phosphocarrier protein FPr